MKFEKIDKNDLPISLNDSIIYKQCYNKYQQMMNSINIDFLKSRENLNTNTVTANTTMEDNIIVLSDSDTDNEEKNKKLIIIKNNKINNEQNNKKENLNKKEIFINENISNNLIQNKTSINDISKNDDENIPLDDPEKLKILLNQPKKLVYTREIFSTTKHRNLCHKLKVRINFGEYKNKVPNLIFNRPNFTYTPHYLRQAVTNKGFVYSFPNLIKQFHDNIIKQDQKLVYTYYFKQKRGKQTSLDIKIKDFKTLYEGNFLNDGIVNFYLQIIEDEYIPINNNGNILIVKSFFYNLLSNQQKQLQLLDNFTNSYSCYFNKTKINVFNFKTLIIPICEDLHWSLIIVNDIDKRRISIL